MDKRSALQNKTKQPQSVGWSWRLFTIEAVGTCNWATAVIGLIVVAFFTSAHQAEKDASLPLGCPDGHAHGAGKDGSEGLS